MPNSEDFPQIKRDLINKINSIKTHIDDESVQREEVRVLLGKVSLAVFGDPSITPPIEGYHQRLLKLEAIEKDRIKNKESLIKMATGSITIAVGGAVIWLCNIFRDAFIKH